jgi:hypothetical protein
MNILQVSISLDMAYRISIKNVTYFYFNQPGPDVSQEVSDDFYIKSGKAEYQYETLKNLYLNDLKSNMAVNKDSFDKAIKELYDYNNQINGKIDNIKKASDIINLIVEVLVVFGL